MTNLEECYNTDARICNECYNNNNKEKHKNLASHISNWTENDVSPSDSSMDWDKMRDKFSALGLTNYLSSRAGQAKDRDGIRNGEDLDTGLSPENGEPGTYHHRSEQPLRICPFTTKYVPEEITSEVQQPHPERFDDILIHDVKAENDEEEVVEKDADTQSDSRKTEKADDKSHQKPVLRRKNNEHQLSADVSLWDLRKSFESTSVSCSDPASLDDDSSTPHAQSPETIRKRENKSDSLSVRKESIVNEATSEECDNEITVLNEHSNHNTPAKRGNSKPSHSPRKSIHTLRDVRKKCKWFSKTCYDSPVDDDIELEPRDIYLARHPPVLVDNYVRDDRNRGGNGHTKLLSPTRDHTTNAGIPIPAESSSCSITPDSISSESASKQAANSFPQDDTTSNESSEASSKSPKSDSLQNLSRIFRRSHFKHRVPSPSFCGYSLERDYCVDVQTDRIFKEFLKPDPNLTSDRTNCFRRPPTCRNKTATQLRRQVMRKQYSDSVAVYYGQRMRRWRVKKQRSDSVNCPVDRAVLRRQEQIEEEYYPNDLEEMSNPPRDNRILPEQNEPTRNRKFIYRSQSTDVDP